MTRFAADTRRLLLVALLAALSVPAPAALGSQPGSAAPQQTTSTPRDPEAEGERPAPVLLAGDTVIWVMTGVGPYSAQFRADRISQRLYEIVRDRRILDPRVTVTEVEDSSELRVGPRLVMVVTQRDATSLGGARAFVAQQYAGEFETAIRAERLRYAPATLIRSGIYGLFATLVLGVTVWLILRVARSFRDAIERRRPREQGSLETGIVSADHLSRAIDQVIRVIRFVLILLVFGVYLTLVLGLFPWTRAVSARLLSYVLTPIRAAAAAFVGYLPNFLFVIVIGTIIYSAIRLVGFVLQPDPAGSHRVRELSRRVGRPDEQDRQRAAVRVRRGRRVSLPAGIGFAGVRRRVGVHRRPRLAVIELGALEHDRRPRPDLHRRVPAGRSRQARRRVRRHHRDIAARDARPNDQERGHHHPEQHRAQQRRHQLLRVSRRRAASSFTRASRSATTRPGGKCTTC